MVWHSFVCVYLFEFYFFLHSFVTIHFIQLGEDKIYDFITVPLERSARQKFHLFRANSQRPRYFFRI